MAQEIDFLGLLEKRETLLKQYKEDLDKLDAKYSSELRLYCTAVEEFNEQSRKFKEAWDPIIKPYLKERKALKRKYKGLGKKP